MSADDPTTAMSFEDFRRSVYYGSRSDMQFKYLVGMSDEAAADAVADILGAVGEVLDTGDLERLREVTYRHQAGAYAQQVEPEVDDAPFTVMRKPLPDAKLALLSAGGVFLAADDPMGPDGPTQAEVLPRIKEFLKGEPVLSVIPRDTPDEALTARHPGYDARSAQRDPGAVFPLAHLRDLAAAGDVTLAEHHYGFTGATSQVRLRNEVAGQWAEKLRADEVDAAFLVAT